MHLPRAKRRRKFDERVPKSLAGKAGALRLTLPARNMKKIIALVSLFALLGTARAQEREDRLRLNEYESALVSGIPLMFWLETKLYHPDSSYREREGGWKNPVDAAARALFHNALFQNHEKLPAAISDHLRNAVILYPLLFFPRKNEPTYELHQPFSLPKDARFIFSYLEAQSATLLVTQLAKFLGNRQRPWVAYENFSAPLYRAGRPERANVSFFSGHTSVAFASASFHHRMLERFQGKRFGEAEVWGVYLAATVTGLMRISADKHYLTDVLTGAAVGTLIARWVVDLSDYEIEGRGNEAAAARTTPLFALRIQF